MKNLKILPLIPIFVFILLIGLFAYGMWGKRDAKEISPMIGRTLPQFVATNLNSEEIATQDFDNSPIIINFFASWCGPCREENQILLQMAQHENIKIIGIAYKDDVQKTKDYLAELGNPYDLVIADRQGNIGSNFGLGGVPETFAINKNNIIKFKKKGKLLPTDAQTLIDAALTQ